MCRFQEADSETYNLLDRLIGDRFPYLSGCQISIVFDTKKRKSGGEFILAKIQSTNELLKFYSTDNDLPQGADYILFLDKEVWSVIEEVDKKRVIFHELCHTSVDLDKKQPYSLRNHDINMFSEELTENKEDPKWLLRLVTIADSIYSKEK